MATLLLVIFLPFWLTSTRKTASSTGKFSSKFHREKLLDRFSLNILTLKNVFTVALRKVHRVKNLLQRCM